MKIVKRDGIIVEFDKEKPIAAMTKAFLSIDKELDDYSKAKIEEIANYLENNCRDGITVEEIQDIIEKKLMDSKRKDVARAYISYRNERTRIRNKASKLNKIITEKLLAKNVQNQNANVDEHSFGGRRGEAMNEYMKDYALNYIMSETARNNHLNNEIYTHKLNCA